MAPFISEFKMFNARVSNFKVCEWVALVLKNITILSAANARFNLLKYELLRHSRKVQISTQLNRRDARNLAVFKLN